MFARRNKRRSRRKTVLQRRLQLQRLENRQLLAVLVSPSIEVEADNVSQFQAGAAGSYKFDTFLGAEFDTGIATIGGIIPVIETGLEAKLGLNGRIGFQVGASVSPGAVTAVSEFVVEQSYPDEIMLGPVLIDTSVRTSGGSQPLAAMPT